MQAVLFDTFRGRLSLESVPDPEPTRDGAVIRVHATGLCRSDWHGWMGHDSDVKLPHVPGHEFAGVVEEIGAAVHRFQPGDRVTVPFCVGCGTCEQCLAGHQQVCDRYYQPGFTGWGSFAERVAIPHADANLVRLPTEIDDLAAASLGCRFVTAYRALVTQAALQPHQWFVTHGCGGVGLAAIQIAKAVGAHVIGVDVNQAGLDWARQLGADEILLGDRQGRRSRDVVQQIRDWTGGGAHVSMDAIGSLTTCQQSVRCLRKRGCHLQVGLMVGDEANAPLPMHVVIAKELKIIGSHGMSATGYPELMERLRSGQLNPGQLVARTVTLADLVELLPRVEQQQAGGITIAVL